MGSDKLIMYVDTLRHLKPIQLYYQVHRRYVSRFFKPKLNVSFNLSKVLNLEKEVSSYSSFTSPYIFNFLNLKKDFVDIKGSESKAVDWNFNAYGKLWTYNLNYFDFLHQENLSKEEGLKLLNDFCDSKDSHLDGYEPYPISLRGINWIKFLIKHNIDDQRINQQLYNDYIRLNASLEYQHLGNHLFENGFSLLFGAYYFQDEKFYKVALKILKSELDEQILPDGANYELSPMYHCIILNRVLDCYNLVVHNPWKENEMADVLKEKASLMLGWLKAIQFKGGDLPMVNDSTTNIAPTPAALFEYASRLKIDIQSRTLKESGYRKLRADKLEALMDVGQIAPSYQPAHSHADSLQIILYSEGLPLIVDTGISTYEKNERRQLERSTCSHNTVTVNNLNSSQVWSGFRVASRATVAIIEESKDRVFASHDGYRALGISHQREVSTLNNELRICDTVTGSKIEDVVQGHLHLHPDVKFQVQDATVILNDLLEIRFPKGTKIELIDYLYCLGYNNLVPSKKLIYTFNNQISFTITHL